MDDPEALAAEWERKNPHQALDELYDDILVYGLPEICDPLAGIPLSDRARAKMTYTGYLASEGAGRPSNAAADPWQGQPYVLVTPGGGRDGEDLVDWLLSAYETDESLSTAALVVFGPFMRPKRRARFLARIERLQRVRAITFDNRLERLMAGATGVVAMGGYNTFLRNPELRQTRHSGTAQISARRAVYPRGQRRAPRLGAHAERRGRQAT